MRKQRMQVFLLILCLKSFLCEAYSAAKPEFHTILSQEEIKRYLDAESQELVPDYDVVRVSHQRTKREASSAEKNYRLTAFGKDFNLVLQPNEDVISERGLIVERRIADGLMTRDSHVPEGRFYVGHVASDPGSHVAVRESAGQLSGAILSDGHVYKIEHLSDDLHRRALLDGNMYHVISRRSADSIFATGKRSEPVNVPDTDARSKEFLPLQDQSESNHDGSKRSEVYQGKIYIEAMLTADKTTCDFYGNRTRDYLLNAANLISRLYKDSSIGMDVSWTLVKIFLVEAVVPDLDFTIKKITSAAKYLAVYRKWAAQRNTPNGSPEHYDHSALLTRRPCGLNDCYLDGLAYGYKPCSKNFGVSINDARGLSVAFTVAHEMAHNLGVGHDHKECAKGYIMQASQSSGPNAFHWSPCSRARLQHVFTSHKCFHNKPPKELPVPSLVPGYAIAVHEQCQMAFGPDSRACFPGKSCGALYCTTTGNSCYSRGAPVSEGTVCGDRKWCHKGECTDVGTSLPPPIDGGWGPWEKYGTCTRTCGGGITYQFRRCNNPVPQYFGKSCQGPDKRFYELCNTQECSSGNFRNEQCKAINQNYYSYKSPDSAKCTLICADSKLGRAWYFGHVKDGTRCVNNPHVFDVCIQGKCLPVGCDKLLGSGKVDDRCLTCGGDGSSCIKICRTYTKDYRRYGRYNGDVMVTIPKGATNVKIVEQAPSFNFISVKSNTTSRYYVRVPSWTRTIDVAGMSIYHYMKKYTDAEKIYIRGPTTEDLDAMFVYSGRQKNPGIYYEFYVPGKAAPTTFYWHSKESQCSATCAGGIKLYKVTCHRSDDHSEVSPVYCDASTKPVESVPCNMDPCPPQFKVGLWSPCSERCGGGLQNRTLTCVQVLSSNRTKAVNESLCAKLHRPATTQQCGKVDCLPQWIIGDWSECSVPCGDGGIRNRTVECKKQLANHTWVVLPVRECEDGANEIPAQTSNCPAMSACHTWNVSYPCVSCGGSNKSFVPVGCFQDAHKKSRPLPEMLSNHRNQINWHKMSLTVRACAEDAWKKKYPVFGVQFYGECWSGPRGYVTYDEDGFNFQGCWEGVGKSSNNYVYAFTSLVVEPLVRCIYTPNYQTVVDDRCASSPRPQPKMKLCQHGCKS